MIAAGQIIWTEKIRIVSILLSSKRMKPNNIALAPGCDSNLILIGQLRESKITSYNILDAMILMKDGKVIAHAKKSRIFLPSNLHNQKKLWQ